MILFALLACVARADPQPATPPTPPAQKEAPAVTETIEETTVGDLGGNRVPMGNMSQRQYTRGDGTTSEGWTCTLALESGATVVGVGSVVEVGGHKWEVTTIEKTTGSNGSVTLVQR